MSINVNNLYAIFNWVVNSSIKVSVLVVIILLIRVLFKGKISPKLNYILWLIVILRIMIPDIYRSDFSIYKFAPVVNEGMTIVETSYNTAGEMNAKDTQTATENVITNDGDNPYSNKTNPPAKAINFRDISFIVWLIGLITIMGTTLIININFLRKIRKETTIKKPSVIRIFDRCKEEMGISKNIMLIETKEVKVLGLLGFFSPKILFPEGLIYKLDEDSLRYVFLHELSHLKRKDILLNWTTSVLTAFHWFNPIVWYGFYKMREDVELCCDSLVMTQLKNEETINYGYTIIKLAENMSTKTPMLVTASMAGNRSQIKRRINMVKLFKKYPYKLSAAAILIIALIGTIALIGANRNMDSSTGSNIDSNIISEDSVNIPKEVIIYTPHPNEFYANGINAMYVGKKLAESLKSEGGNCTFFEIPMDMKREGSLEKTRELITSNVTGYKDKVLIDIHIDYPAPKAGPIPSDLILENVPQGIRIFVSNKNANFEENNKFAELLLKELKKNTNMPHEPVIIKTESMLNQDLSPNSLHIRVGSSIESNEEVNVYLNALSTSLEKVVPQLK